MYHFPILVIYRLSVSEFGSSIIFISDCVKPIFDFYATKLMRVAHVIYELYEQPFMVSVTRYVGNYHLSLKIERNDITFTRSVNIMTSL
jgi:hypothetical protein